MAYRGRVRRLRCGCTGAAVSGLAVRGPGRGASDEHDSSEEVEMSEHHRIVGAPHGEPLPKGRVGVRVCVPLSGCPSSRWSLDLRARLTNELVGHPAVGHLRLNDLVQGDQIVLEGVEEREAPLLSQALRRAIDATNAACAVGPKPSGNVPTPEADAIAHKVVTE
jgi:hypothetical protein